MMHSRWRGFGIAACAIVLALLGAHAGAQLAPPAAPFEADIQHFETDDRAHPPAAGGIVFVGSSSIRMWTSLAADFPDKNVLNRGFGGSTIADAARYAGRIVTNYRPRQIVLYAGDNDVAAGASAQQVLADFKAFVEAVRRDLPRVPIVFISIKPSPARANLLATTRSANQLIEAYAQQQKNIRYLDVFTPMLGADGQLRADLFGPDRLHMSRAGYALWIDVIRPALR
jgi:lysophospholipase L1-like esterase